MPFGQHLKSITEELMILISLYHLIVAYDILVYGEADSNEEEYLNHDYKHQSAP